jgi:hypothetical protein
MAGLKELLGNRAMAEKDAEGFERSNLRDSGLQKDIAHWAEVLDRWVKVVDTRLGRHSEVGGPAPPLDGHHQPAPDELNGGLGAEE